MTNREAHEEAASMGLDDMFFRMNGIDPNAEYKEISRCSACGYTYDESGNCNCMGEY